jgi:hypothetical protein
MLVMLATAAAATVCGAGVVHTASQRLDGKLTLGRQITVGAGAVDLGEALFVQTDAPASRPTAGCAVRTRDGEVWVCDVLSLEAGKLAIRLVGGLESRVDAASLSEIDFATHLAAAAPPAEGVLYRQKSENVPGNLMWMSATELGIDSLLGVLTLPREGSTRFVFAAQTRPAHGADEVVLTDGSVFRGRVSGADGALHLQHAVFGKLTFASDRVRYFARSETAFLADMPAEVKADSLVGLSTPPQTVTMLRPQLAAPSSPTGLRSIRVEPRTSITYRLDSGPHELRLAVERASDARGDVLVRVRSGSVKLLEKEFDSAARPLAISLEVPGRELSIDVEFGTRMGFPCAVVLNDPLVLPRRAAPQTAPATQGS